MSNVITLLKNKNNSNLDKETILFIKNNIYSCFWDNFSFKENTIYIGKLIDGIKIPHNMEKFLDNLVSCIMNNKENKENNENDENDNVYIKIYITKNVYTNSKTINLLIVADGNELSEDIKNSLLYSMFEIYKITESMIQSNKDFKNIIEHYLLWNNYYNNTKLLLEKEY